MRKAAIVLLAIAVLAAMLACTTAGASCYSQVDNCDAWATRAASLPTVTPTD